MELKKAYNPKDTEDKIYKLWEKSGFFNPDKLPKRKKKNYCIVIPPPNVTGQLHMGHALNAACQDVLIRRKRMEGVKTLWLPGIDHAGIATQYVVEKELKKEGKTRFDLGREKFTEKVWEWKKKYGNIILDQFKKLGCSLDWSRTRFTMDKDYSEAVKKVFSHYHKKGWIYQGERAVNWCSRCSTGLSDLEVIYKEEPALMYYITYGPLTIATVRPETKLGDTAVAVNPKDGRYNQYIGKTIDINTVLGKAQMRVIGDESVDMDFGTGAMKVTPAHDIHDFELGEKHNLEKKQVIGPDGKMTKLAKKYAGLKVAEARKQVVEDMKKIGILKKTEPYNHSVARCYRCNTTLEPILSKQWFLKMKELAKIAQKPVKQGKIRFYP
ncbi:class I tRNA ligase family protein, partial [Patescibacteria group bacterium]